MTDETQEDLPGVLACDVGNSAIHVAYVRGETVTETLHFRMGELAALGKSLGELWEQIPAPRKVVAASVNSTGLKALEAAAMESLHQSVLVIGREVPLPIDTDLPNPEKIGVDRLCAAVAAFDRLGVSCVVADFGTAITIDCVNAEGVFVGGAILPGLGMGAASLHAATAQLPQVELRPPDWVYGKNTEQAIIGGLVFGARGALKELVENYATDLGHWPIVILTGSDARLVCPEVSESQLAQAIVPDLVIRGIAAAYYRTLVK